MHKIYIIITICLLALINGCAPKPGSPEAALKIKKEAEEKKAALKKDMQKPEKSINDNEPAKN